jgi:hypothetical protein
MNPVDCVDIETALEQAKVYTSGTEGTYVVYLRKFAEFVGQKENCSIAGLINSSFYSDDNVSKFIYKLGIDTKY